MINLGRKFLVITFVISVSTSFVFAEVKAYLNQSSFYEGDPITLKIETTENNQLVPDLSPLANDFSVIGTSTNFRTTIINGRGSSLRTWVIELQPNKKGVLVIPAISIGNNKTKPLSLTITDLPPEVKAETNKHIFVEEKVGAVSRTTFVQQQIPYTVKLFYDEAMQTAQIYSPNLENAILEKLGADKRYQVVRAGKRFNVVEKRYVISPEKSGTLHIPAPTVKGRISVSGGDSPKPRKRMDDTDMLNRFFNGLGNDPFFQDFGGFFSRRSREPSKPFTVTGNSIDVEVLPVPKEFTGSAWLPAEDLSIKDSWTSNPPELKVGEPVTRFLTLHAKGLAGSQIPDIAIVKPQNMKSYPEKAKSETRTDGNTVYGIQHIEISYIPDRKGQVTIPEVKVDWWDVNKKKQQTFILPEWNLTVAPDLSVVADEKPEIGILETPLETKDESQSLEQPKGSSENNYWTIAIITAVSILLAVGALIFYWIRRKSRLNHLKKTQPTKNINELKASLLQACKNNDKTLSANSLLEYARNLWADDSIQNLGDLSSQLNDGVEIIKKLEQGLYRADSQKWNGSALATLVENGLPQRQNSAAVNNDGLVPLYPD